MTKSFIEFRYNANAVITFRSMRF